MPNKIHILFFYSSKTPACINNSLLFQAESFYEKKISDRILVYKSTTSCIARTLNVFASLQKKFTCVL